jgi:hypothetical protein
VVAVAVLALLSAIILATVVVERGRSRISESHEILADLVRTLRVYDSATAFTTNPPLPGRFPLLLTHLTDEITSAESANCPLCRNSCGSGAAPPAQSVYSATNVNGWRASGPFYSRPIAFGVGFRIPIGIVRDTLFRNPPTATNADLTFARLQIRIDSVLLTDAQDLDERVDGSADPTVGAIRWTAAPDADGILSSIFWNMPIAGC